MEDAAEQLDQLAQSVAACELCADLVATRQRAVAGAGHPHCRVMLIGLAPDEADEQPGETAGGTLLADLTTFMPALNHAGDQLYCTTIVKCVPRSETGRRDPNTTELDHCFAHLSREISITTPHYILTVGEPATHYVLGRLFKTAPYRDGDALELRVFDNPAFRVIPLATPTELRARSDEERSQYVERLAKLAQVLEL